MREIVGPGSVFSRGHCLSSHGSGGWGRGLPRFRLVSELIYVAFKHLEIGEYQGRRGACHGSGGTVNGYQSPGAWGVQATGGRAESPPSPTTIFARHFSNGHGGLIPDGGRLHRVDHACGVQFPSRYCPRTRRSDQGGPQGMQGGSREQNLNLLQICFNSLQRFRTASPRGRADRPRGDLAVNQNPIGAAGCWGRGDLGQRQLWGLGQGAGQKMAVEIAELTGDPIPTEVILDPLGCITS